jgi:hypothetical protein
MKLMMETTIEPMSINCMRKLGFGNDDAKAGMI